MTLPPEVPWQYLGKVLVVTSGEALLACGVMRPGMQSSKLHSPHYRELSSASVNSGEGEKHYSKQAVLQHQCVYESLGHSI